MLRLTTSFSRANPTFSWPVSAARPRGFSALAFVIATLVLAVVASLTSATSAVATSSSSGKSPASSSRALAGSAPASALAASLSTPIWTSNYNSGTLNSFQSTPWNNVPYRPTITATPVIDGRYAGKYVIPAGGNRCENVPRVRTFGERDDYWFGFAVRVGSDFNLTTGRWQVLAQLKNDGIGSPPLELTVSRGYLRVEGGYGWPGNTWAIRPRLAAKAMLKIRAGAWYRVWLHVKFSSNHYIGWVSAYVNGVRKVTYWHMPGGTLYPHLRSYLKVGYYRDPGIGQRSTVIQDRVRVGRSVLAVR